MGTRAHASLSPPPATLEACPPPPAIPHGTPIPATFLGFRDSARSPRSARSRSDPGAHSSSGRSNRPLPHAPLFHGSLILLCSLRLGWRQALGCDSGGPGGPFPGPLSHPRGGVGWAAPARALLLVPGVPGTDSKGVGTEKNRELGQGRSEYSPVQRRAGPPVTRSPVLVAGPTRHTPSARAPQSELSKHA